MLTVGLGVERLTVVAVEAVELGSCVPGMWAAAPVAPAVQGWSVAASSSFCTWNGDSETIFSPVFA